MRLLSRMLVSAACAALAVAASPAAAKAPKPPPATFFGVDAWTTPSPHEFSRMAKGRIGVYRFLLNWSFAERCAGCRDWSASDKDVANAARAHVRALPFVWGSPSFLEREPRLPPLSPSGLNDYSAFMADVVKRYGTQGSFWNAHPEIPREPLAGIQVWNEPSHPYFWSSNPRASDYVRLLKAASKATRAADPGTKVVVAGIPNVGGKRLVDYVTELYRVAGFRKAFDVMALHPYAITAQAIFDTMARVRSIMTSHRDGGKQTWITETGWASTKMKYFAPFAGSPKGQANVLTQLYRGLISRRKSQKIGAVMWFSWRDRRLAKGEKDGWVTHTGLFQIGGKPKPAWKALVKITGGKPGSGSL